LFEAADVDGAKPVAEISLHHLALDAGVVLTCTLLFDESWTLGDFNRSIC